MMRLLAPCFALALVAQPNASHRGPQVWEEGRTVLTTLDPELRLSFITRGRQSLIALGRQGQPAEELRLPGTLRWPSLSYWKGRSYAYGFPPHPAWHFPNLGKRAWGFPPQALADAYQRSEHHLYQSTDFKSWQFLARYRPDEDHHGRIRELLPLEDGSFLAIGIFSFWEGDRVSPVARYRVDGRGHLMFERLVELGPSGIYDTIPHPTLVGQKSTQDRPGYEGIGKWPWLIARTPEGVVLFDVGGWYFVLDNRDGHCLRQGRIPAPEGRNLRILDAEPDPEGRILVASTCLRGKDEASLSPFTRPGDSPSAHLARQLMLFKVGSRRLVNDLEGSTPLAWHRLNPATGRLSQELPPRGVPALLKDREARWTFRFTIRPDGDLEVFQQPTVQRRLLP